MEKQMQNIRLHGKQFEPNRSRKNTFTMNFIGSMFVAMGAMLWLFSYPRTFSGGNPGFIFGICFFGFGTIMLVVMFFLSTVNVSYYVSHTGIILKRGKYIFNILFDEIAEIKVLDEKKSEDKILHLENSYFKEDKGKYVNYYPGTGVTNIVFSERRFGSLMFMSSLVASWRVAPTELGGVDLPCDTVEIHLKNHDTYLITPFDSHGFVKEVKDRLNG